MSEEVGSPEVAPVTEENVAPDVQVVEPTTPQDSAPEQTPVEEKPKDSAPKGDWVQKRLDQLTREKHEARLRAEAAEARIRQYEQPAQDGQTATAPVDIEKVVEQRLKQRDFDAACNKVFESGTKEFPDFDKSLQTFQLLGGAPAAFLEAVTSLDNGHKVIHHLGQNPEAAERLLGLTPTKMALELVRLETSLAQPKPVSKVPAPISPVGGKTTPVEPEEFKDTASYIEARRKQLASKR